MQKCSADDRSDENLGEKWRELLPNNFEHGEFGYTGVSLFTVL